MQPKYLLLLLFPVVMFTSCKKFLDVKPKTQIDAEDAFSHEQGYMDALTGVYLKLNDNALYGKELTFGLTEVLSKQYTSFRVFQEYYEAASYNYLNAATRAKIDAIWLNMYASIANANNLIGHLNTVDQKIFREENYKVISGEAHALRALMHFDLLRLFAPAVSSANGNDQPAIPYKTELNVNVSPQLKVQEVIIKILDDLQVAEGMLKVSDPLVPGSKSPATITGYLRDRQYKFNYYAVKALQARVYLYAGDKEKALACATEVINSKIFTLTPRERIGQGDRIMSTELIFGLYKSDMASFGSSYFAGQTPNLLTKSSEGEFQQVYEGTNDVRYVYLTALETVPKEVRYPIKFSQVGVLLQSYLGKIPVIRLSEVYYIAAECVKETSMSDATTYLNTVRQIRNVTNDLPPSLTPDALQHEVFKEYRKEFLCEGQLFYYYKRLNAQTIEYSTVKGDNKIYVLPVPDNEVEYGKIK